MTSTIGKVFLVATSVLLVVLVLMRSMNLKLQTVVPNHPFAKEDFSISELADICERKLDELDEVWDKRRDALLEMIKGKTAAEQPFDDFEPEAGCLDDERFWNTLMKYSTRDGEKLMWGIRTSTEEKKNCLIYNVGSNNQIEFEQEMHHLMGAGCEIHTFDPTVPPSSYQGHAYSAFHDWGLGEDGKNAVVREFSFDEMSLLTVMKRLLTAMKRLGHVGQTIDMFNIDCEGCEFPALTDALNAIAKGKIKIDQIQVKIHAPGGCPAIQELFLAADKANMRIFHKEGNHGNKWVEFTFASNDFLRRANAHRICGWIPGLSVRN